KWLLAPPAPAIAKAKTGRRSHRVEFGRPCVADPYGKQPNSSIGQSNQLTVDPLLVDMMARGVQPDRIRLDAKDRHALTSVEARRIRNERLDQKCSALLEHCSDPLKALHLFLLGPQREECAERDEDQSKLPVERHGREVGHRHWNVRPS